VVFGVELAAHRKAGWFRRGGGDPRELARRLERMVGRMARGELDSAKWRNDRFVVKLALHPYAPPAQLVVDATGVLRVRAATALVGPGYHQRVLERVAPILDELDLAWEDETAARFDLARVQRDTGEWLAGELRAGTRVVGLEREFSIDAAVLTPLGPRDAAWREEVLAEPLRAADAFAWWQPGPGTEALSRALLAMWHEVPWREPLDDDELALMNEVDADLCTARREDEGLALPWPEWAALLGYLGKTNALADEVRARADGRQPMIGYRRHDIDVELTGGWIARLPGAFIGSWRDDGARYWATDGERSVDFTSLTAQDDSTSEALLAVATPRHPVIERFASGNVCGRAEAYDEDHLRVVVGLVVDAPHVAILTCKGRAADQPWALATWRGLRVARSTSP
jgi:hypothetical protein